MKDKRLRSLMRFLHLVNEIVSGMALAIGVVASISHARTGG
jgi:hypothetical protein